MIRIKLWCEDCDDTFEQEVEFMSDINWACILCKGDNTWFRDSISDEPVGEPITLGKGGCGNRR